MTVDSGGGVSGVVVSVSHINLTGDAGGERMAPPLTWMPLWSCAAVLSLRAGCAPLVYMSSDLQFGRRRRGWGSVGRR